MDQSVFSDLLIYDPYRFVPTVALMRDSGQS